MDAMEDVTPIGGADRHTLVPHKAGQPFNGDSGETGVMDRLRRLVACGHGFEVSHTPEYMEGRGYNVGREVTRKLYNGDFSIQDHIDLHGLTAADARDAFLAFMESAIANGKRAVLIVHGRGLSSPVAPVLKGKVMSWLTRSAIRKWVLAFTSARACDGGAGATYVLLRLRPVTKRFRKGKKEKRDEG
jgi:DNA-nicking Smr family endonuclease